jgi:RISC-loading complex subunit TARBP2
MEPHASSSSPPPASTEAAAATPAETADEDPSSTSPVPTSSVATKTPVSLLQELYVKRGITPKYDLVQIEGAVHEPTFKYRVTVGDFMATGCGQSKKKAKHTAAKAVLDKIRAVQKQQQLQLQHEGGGAEGIAVGEGVLCKKADVSIISELEVADLASPYDDGIEGNPVGELQEICMNRRMQPPIYEGEKREIGQIKD